MKYQNRLNRGLGEPQGRSGVFWKTSFFFAANRTLHCPTRGPDTILTKLPLFFLCSVEMSDSSLLLSMFFPPFNGHPIDDYCLPSCDANKVALNAWGSNIYRNVGACLSQYSYMKLTPHKTTNVKLDKLWCCAVCEFYVLLTVHPCIIL